MKELILLRGLPGSGKSTLADVIGGVRISADMYFVDWQSGKYNFNPALLKNAHQWCLDTCEFAMTKTMNEKICVANTFTQEWEMENYYKLAEKHGYQIHSIIVENRHGGKNIHNVPDEKVEQMKNRFSIKL